MRTDVSSLLYPVADRTEHPEAFVVAPSFELGTARVVVGVDAEPEGLGQPVADPAAVGVPAITLRIQRFGSDLPVVQLLSAAPSHQLPRRGDALSHRQPGVEERVV